MQYWSKINAEIILEIKIFQNNGYFISKKSYLFLQIRSWKWRLKRKTCFTVIYVVFLFPKTALEVFSLFLAVVCCYFYVALCLSRIFRNKFLIASCCYDCCVAKKAVKATLGFAFFFFLILDSNRCRHWSQVIKRPTSVAVL